MEARLLRSTEAVKSAFPSFSPPKSLSSDRVMPSEYPTSKPDGFEQDWGEVRTFPPGEGALQVPRVPVHERAADSRARARGEIRLNGYENSPDCLHVMWQPFHSWRKWYLQILVCSKMCYGLSKIRHERANVSPLGRIRDAQERRSDMTCAGSAVIAMSALVMLSTGLSAQTTGVAACDDFLKKYEACVTSKVPAAQKAAFQGQLEQMRKAWSDAAKAPGAKATLESTCKQSADQMKAAMSAFGCTF